MLRTKSKIPASALSIALALSLVFGMLPLPAVAPVAYADEAGGLADIIEEGREAGESTNLDEEGYGAEEPMALEGEEEYVSDEPAPLANEEEYNEVGLMVGATPGTYIAAAQGAVSTTNKILKTLGVSKWGSFGEEVVKYSGYLEKGLGVTNTVLKIFGLGKSSGPSKEDLIYEEVKQIHEELQDLNRMVSEELQDISNQISTLDVKAEYRSMIEKSETLWHTWNEIQTDSFNKIDASIAKYKDAMSEDVRVWCENDEGGARTRSKVDNTAITVIYDENGELVFTAKNTVPEAYESCSHITLKEACIPDTFDDWSIDTYQQDLSAYIDAAVRSALEGDGELSDYLEASGMSIFTREGWAAASVEEQDAAIEQLCGDAIDQLTYRLSVVTAKTHSAEITEINTYFNQLCESLQKTKDWGMYAPLQSLCLSHGFEGEVRDEMTSLTSSVLMKLSEYATICLDGIGKCPSISSSEADTIAQNWNDTVAVIDKLTSTMLSGSDDYCYVTGTHLQISQAPLEFEDWYSRDEDLPPYEGKLIIGSPEKDHDAISETAAQILAFTKNGNPEYADMSFEEYLCTYCGSDFSHYASEYGEPSAPRIYVLDSAYTKSEYSNKEDIALQSLQVFTSHPEHNLISTQVLEWKNSFGYDGKHYIVIKEVSNNVKIQMARILDTQTGNPVSNANLCGVIGVHPGFQGCTPYRPTQCFDFEDYQYFKKYEEGLFWVTLEQSGGLYCLVNKPAALKAAGASGGDEDNFLNVMNDTVASCTGEGSATSLGSGNALYTAVLALLGIAAIAIACFVAYRRRKGGAMQLAAAESKLQEAEEDNLQTAAGEEASSANEAEEAPDAPSPEPSSELSSALSPEEDVPAEAAEGDLQAQASESDEAPE